VALQLQAVIAIPLAVFVSLFGFTKFCALNMAIGILGYYSLAIAIFNLIPLHPLDGAKA
jgi:Zn-dependent protease